MGGYKENCEKKSEDRMQRDTQRLIRPAKFPDGTVQMVSKSCQETFQVRVCYREPDFEQRTGRQRDKPFSWTFEVRAPSPAGAQAEAVRQFRETEKQSSVNWAREIVDVFVVRS